MLLLLEKRTGKGFIRSTDFPRPAAVSSLPVLAVLHTLIPRRIDFPLIFFRCCFFQLGNRNDTELLKVGFGGCFGVFFWFMFFVGFFLIFRKKKRLLNSVFAEVTVTK